MDATNSLTASMSPRTWGGGGGGGGGGKHTMRVLNASLFYRA